MRSRIAELLLAVTLASSSVTAGVQARGEIAALEGLATGELVRSAFDGARGATEPQRIFDAARATLEREISAALRKVRELPSAQAEAEVARITQAWNRGLARLSLSPRTPSERAAAERLEAWVERRRPSIPADCAKALARKVEALTLVASRLSVGDDGSNVASGALAGLWLCWLRDREEMSGAQSLAALSSLFALERERLASEIDARPARDRMPALGAFERAAKACADSGLQAADAARHSLSAESRAAWCASEARAWSEWWDQRIEKLAGEALSAEIAPRIEALQRELDLEAARRAGRRSWLSSRSAPDRSDAWSAEPPRAAGAHSTAARALRANVRELESFVAAELDERVRAALDGANGLGPDDRARALASIRLRLDGWKEQRILEPAIGPHDERNRAQPEVEDSCAHSEAHTGDRSAAAPWREQRDACLDGAGAGVRNAARDFVTSATAFDDEFARLLADAAFDGEVEALASAPSNDLAAALETELRRAGDSASERSHRGGGIDFGALAETDRRLQHVLATNSRSALAHVATIVRTLQPSASAATASPYAAAAAASSATPAGLPPIRRTASMSDTYRQAAAQYRAAAEQYRAKGDMANCQSCLREAQDLDRQADALRSR